jgi:hypothetical protein
MPSIVSLTRFIGEIGLSLGLTEEVVATSFVYLHAAVKELSLTQLGSDAIALATAAVILAAKVKESQAKQNDIVEVAVKLACEKPTLSIEVFADRKRILKDKAGLFETLIVRLHPLDFQLGFYYLSGICADKQILHMASKLLVDFYRSSLALEVPCEELAEGARLFAEVVTTETKVNEGTLAKYTWLPELLEDVYT